MPIVARVGTSDNDVDVEAGDSPTRRVILKALQALPKTPDKGASEWMVSNTDMLIQRLRPSMSDSERQETLRFLYGTGPGALFVEGILEETANSSSPDGAMPMETRVIPVWMADP